MRLLLLAGACVSFLLPGLSAAEAVESLSQLRLVNDLVENSSNAAVTIPAAAGAGLLSPGSVMESEMCSGLDCESFGPEAGPEELFLMKQILPAPGKIVLPAANPSFAPSALPLVIGHRGFGEKTVPEPESTLAALERGFAMGAGAVELDVQLSRDGELVLTHNINVDAISTSRGCVADFTREELQGLVLLDGDKRPSTERMAAFADVLPMLRRQADTHAGDAGAGIVAVVHIKIFDGFHGDWPGGNLLHRPCPKTDYKAIARKTYEAVESAGLTGRIMFVSFDYRVLDVIRSARSDARVGLLSIRRTPAITAAASRRYDAVALYHDRVQRRDLERARAHGLRVYVWSPTKKQSIEKFATEKGKVGKVDGIITNSIPDAIECVSARQGAGKNR